MARLQCGSGVAGALAVSFCKLAHFTMAETSILYVKTVQLAEI